VSAGRPVHLTLTVVPVVLLATTAVGLPLYVQLDVDGGIGIADAGVAARMPIPPSRPAPSPSAPAAAPARRRTPRTLVGRNMSFPFVRSFLSPDPWRPVCEVVPPRLQLSVRSQLQNGGDECFSTVRNRGKLCGNQVLRAGADAAKNYSGGGHRQDPNTISLGITSPNRFHRKPAPTQCCSLGASCQQTEYPANVGAERQIARQHFRVPQGSSRQRIAVSVSRFAGDSGTGRGSRGCAGQVRVLAPASADGQRSPHKPLLVSLALGRPSRRASYVT